MREIVIAYMLLFTFTSGTLYYFTRQKTFKYHVLYSISLIAYLLLKSDVVWEFLVDGIGGREYIIHSFNWYIQTIYYSMYALFGLYFIDLHVSQPRWTVAVKRWIYRALIMSSVLFLLCIIFRWRFFYPFMYLFIPLLLTLLVVALTRARTHGNRTRTIFILAAVIYTISALTALSISLYQNAHYEQYRRVLGLTPIGFFYVGIIIDSVLFSIGLGITVKDMYDENLKKNEKLLRMTYDLELSTIQGVLEGESSERKRIAQDLHDSMGVTLSALRRRLQTVASRISDPRDKEEIISSEQALGAALDEVRSLSHRMMPDALVNLGLEAAIEDMASDIMKAYPLSIDIDIESDLIESEAKAFEIYRIIQESINNTIKHAAATKITVSLNAYRTSDGIGRRLVITDDGIGFDRESTDEDGIGISGIKSRVRLLGGTVKLSSDDGTRYEILF